MALALPSQGKTLDEAKNDLAYEFADCAAFYTYSAVGTSSWIGEMPQAKELTENSKKLAEQGIGYSVMMTSQVVAKARFDLSMEGIKRTLGDEGFANWSLVLNDYLYRCKDAYNDPQKRLEYWRTHATPH